MSSKHVPSLQTPKNLAVPEASPRTVAKAVQRRNWNVGGMRRRGRDEHKRAGYFWEAKEHSRGFRCTEVRWKREDQKCKMCTSRK